MPESDAERRVQSANIWKGPPKMSHQLHHRAPALWVEEVSLVDTGILTGQACKKGGWGANRWGFLRSGGIPADRLINGAGQEKPG